MQNGVHPQVGLHVTLLQTNLVTSVTEFAFASLAGVALACTRISTANAFINPSLLIIGCGAT